MKQPIRAVRAVLLGAAISVALTAIWSLLLAANLQLSARLPWSVLTMALVLAVAWRALSGGLWSAHAAERSALLPRRCHSRAHRAWAVAAALALMLGAFAATLLTIRLAHAPVALLPPLASAQPLLAIAYFAMASLVAGVAEETGFRGVMQSLLVRVVPQRSAIAIVAVAFVLLHAGNPEFVAFVPIYVASSIGLSLGVIASGSLWPAISGHVLADFLSYVLLLVAPAEALHSFGAAWQLAAGVAAAALLALAAFALHRLCALS